MAEESEFTVAEIQESLGADITTETGDEDNEHDNDDGNNNLGAEEGGEQDNLDAEEGEEGGEGSGSEEDGDGEGDEEVDPDAEASSDEDDGEDGEGGEEEVQLTPEHEVGAGIHKFMEERIPADRVEEGMANFQKSLNIVADQMNGDYESYWKGLTPSLQQAAMDNPEVFLDTLAPMYQEVLVSAGRMLSAENKVLVDNMEISEEVALKMQKQDHQLNMKQRNIDMFKDREGAGKQKQEQETHVNSMTLSFRETCEAMEKMYPSSVGKRDEIMKSVTDRKVGTPEELKLLVENSYHTHARSNTGEKPKSGQGKKNPLRSNRTNAKSKPATNPDAEFSTDEITASLKSQRA